MNRLNHPSYVREMIGRLGTEERKSVLPVETSLNYEVTKVPKGRGHEYRINRQVVDRVTNIVNTVIAKGGGFDYYLKADAVAGFQRMLTNMPNADFTTQSPYQIMKWFPQERSAMERGTAVHKAIETGDFELAKYHPDDQAYVAAARAFFANEEAEATGQEIVVGSAMWQYAGTLDWRGELNSLPVIIDWKTATKVGTTPYESYHYQLAAYELACVEMGYDPTVRQAIVMLYPDGTYAEFTGQASSDAWLAAINHYNHLKEMREEMQ